MAQFLSVVMEMFYRAVALNALVISYSPCTLQAMAVSFNYHSSVKSIYIHIYTKMTWNKRKSCRNLEAKPGRRPLGRTRLREFSILMALRLIEGCNIDWINLAHDRHQWGIM